MSVLADNLPEIVSKLNKRVDDTYATLSNCYLELENLKLEHSYLAIKLAGKPEADIVNDAIGKIQSSFDPIQKKILQLDDHKDMLQALVREIKNGYKDFSEVVKTHSLKIDDLYKCIEYVKSLVQLARTDLDVNMNSAVSLAKKEIQMKIDDLPIPRSTVTPEEMKKHVYSATESLALDAKNAFMSSQNNETRLDVIEKKIESVLIKIKNVELRSNDSSKQ